MVALLLVIDETAEDAKLVFAWLALLALLGKGVIVPALERLVIFGARLEALSFIVVSVVSVVSVVPVQPEIATKVLNVNAAFNKFLEGLSKTRLIITMIKSRYV